MRSAALAHLAALFLALPALAQTTPQPQLTVTLDPTTPVPVGTPIAVTATVLVPTFLPQPPVWPDLQIADAVTRLPERATQPVTRRIGPDSWSGLSRTWQIIPQRPATYDLGPQTLAITYADPTTSQPVTTTLDLPPITFAATIPPGAEGIDPFLAATSLTLSATLDGLPATPKPGDAVTLTLTTTASGPPAMLLPPLADRLTTPAGLSAYPRQPTLTDGDPATRTETITYVVQGPGRAVIAGLALDWWNTTTATRETATTAPLTIDIPTPPGWHPTTAGTPRLTPILLAAAAFVALALIVTTLARRRRPPAAPSPRTLHRGLLRSARHDPPGAIRQKLTAWQASLTPPLTPSEKADIDAALRPLERSLYGPSIPETSERAARDALVHHLRAARERAAPPEAQPLPTLNPRPTEHA